MAETDLRQIDLNLLLPLRVLLQECHITRAASRCFLSQSAMSRVFQRLRDTFGDELLIRTGRRYERTARAERILRDLDEILPRLEHTIRGDSFNPLQMDERFRVSMTDYASIVLLPCITHYLAAVAPSVRLDVSMRSDDTWRDLETGRIGLAFEVAGVTTGLESKVLFEDEFVCFVSPDHPFKGSRFRMADYLKQTHVLVNVASGMQTLVDRPLADLGVRRKVALAVPYFVPAVLCTERTRHVATVPQRLAKLFAASSGLRQIRAPREISGFKYVMLWHRRSNAERLHEWFRGQVIESLAGS